MQQTKVNWFRVPLDPKLVKELNETDDFKGFKQAGGHVALALFTGIGTYYIWSVFAWYWAIIPLIIHGSVVSMFNAGVHELVHERVFKTTKYNKFFLALLSFFTGWNFPYFNISHKEHHRFTLNPPLDLEVTLPQGQIKAFNWRQFLGYQGLWEQMKLHWDFAINGFQKNGAAGGIHGEKWMEYLFDRLSEKEKNEIRNWSILYLVGHFILVFGGIISGYWMVPLLTTFAPIFGSSLTHLTHAPQHYGLMKSVNDFRLNCRTYTCNKLFMFLYWNMNYHIEHHMYAAVPCYNLPKLHKAILPYLPKVHNSIWDVWHEMRFISFQVEKNPNYEYRQTLPEEQVGGENLVLKHVADSSATGYLELSEKEEKIIEGDLSQYKVWECTICAFIYDEAVGLPEEGIAPGTKWKDIPEDWMCPDCGVAKADFEMVERKRVSTGQQAQGEESFTETTYDEPIVIVGSGIAGYTIAKEYRKLNAKQKVILLTRDGGEYYSKPLLSNALVQKKTSFELVTKKAQSMAEEVGIQIEVATEVLSIDRENKTVKTTVGDMKYSKLVLALGADQRTLNFEGNAADQVVRVNDLSDYELFRNKLPLGGHVLILGAGLIGCEFANDLIDSGYQVTVVDLASAPLSALVPTEVGGHLKEKLEAKGVNWVLETSLKSVDKTDVLFECELSNGETIHTNLVLSSIGLVSRTEVAKDAGLEVHSGIKTNEYLQTNDENIFAIGDCSEVNNRVRLFIAPIRSGADALAKTLAGKQTKVHYDPMPVIVKTPAFPILSLVPENPQDGKWEIEEQNGSLACLFKDSEKHLKGFVLTGEQTEKRNEYLTQIAS